MNRLYLQIEELNTLKEKKKSQRDRINGIYGPKQLIEVQNRVRAGGLVPGKIYGDRNEEAKTHRAKFPHILKKQGESDKIYIIINHVEEDSAGRAGHVSGLRICEARI